MNSPDLAELVTTNLLGRFADDLLRMQESQAAPEPAATQPRFGKDVEGALLLPSNMPRPTKSVPKMGEMMGQMLQASAQPGEMSPDMRQP